MLAVCRCGNNVLVGNLNVATRTSPEVWESFLKWHRNSTFSIRILTNEIAPITLGSANSATLWTLDRSFVFGPCIWWLISAAPQAAAAPFQTQRLPKFGKGYFTQITSKLYCLLRERCRTPSRTKTTVLWEKEHPGQCQAQGNDTIAKGSSQLRTPKLCVCLQFVALRSPALLLLMLHQDKGSDSGSIRGKNQQRSQHIFVLTHSSSPIPIPVSCKSPLSPNPSLCLSLWGRRRGSPSPGVLWTIVRLPAGSNQT